MDAADGIRPGETRIDLPPRTDAGLYFIGRIATPWPDRAACPKRGDPTDGPLCQLNVFAPWRDALAGTEALEALQVLYWMDRARRDLMRQAPHGGRGLHGTFALRSPVRPNPIACSTVRLVAREGDALLVRGLDCIDGTPLIDIKPDRCPNW